MKRHRESGFSTLEVVAAVAIMAIALVPIIGLQTQLSRSQIRLEEAQSDSTAARNTLALIRDINPMVSPQGQRRLDDQTMMTWTSSPSSPLRQSVNPAGFEIQLYRVDATIRRGDNPVTTVRVDLIGWRALAAAENRSPTE